MQLEFKKKEEEELEVGDVIVSIFGARFIAKSGADYKAINLKDGLCALTKPTLEEIRIYYEKVNGRIIKNKNLKLMEI